MKIPYTTTVVVPVKVRIAEWDEMTPLDAFLPAAARDALSWQGYLLPLLPYDSLLAFVAHCRSYVGMTSRPDVITPATEKVLLNQWGYPIGEDPTADDEIVRVDLPFTLAGDTRPVASALWLLENWSWEAAGDPMSRAVDARIRAQVARV